MIMLSLCIEIFLKHTFYTLHVIPITSMLWIALVNQTMVTYTLPSLTSYLYSYDVILLCAIAIISATKPNNKDSYLHLFDVISFFLCHSFYFYLKARHWWFILLTPLTSYYPTSSLLIVLVSQTMFIYNFHTYDVVPSITSLLLIIQKNGDSYLSHLWRHFTNLLTSSPILILVDQPIITHIPHLYDVILLFNVIAINSTSKSNNGETYHHLY